MPNVVLMPSNIVSTVGSFSDVTGLGFAIGANESWIVEFNLLLIGSTSGMAFQLTGPAGTSRVLICAEGHTSSATTWLTYDAHTAFGQQTASYCYFGSNTGLVNIRAAIVNGSNAGNVQLQFACANPGQTNTVVNGSMMRAVKV